MKHIISLVVCFILVTFCLQVKGETKESSTTLPLMEIVELMETNEVEIGDWRLYTRGELQHVGNKFEYDQVVRKLMSENENFHFTKDKSDEHWKVFGSSVHNTLPLVEELTILAYPHGSGYAVYLVYEMHGTGWDELDWSHTSPIFKRQTEKLFPTPSPIFTTVTGNSDSIEQENLYETAQFLTEQLSGETIEALKEETFVSLSAYNEKWNGSISTNGKKMNIQTALRSSGLGGETTVTIGTPIITTEY